MSLSDSLHRVPPESAALQTALLAALNGRREGDLELRAAAAPAEAPAWLRFETPRGALWLAPQIVDGGRAVLTGEDGAPDAAASLTALGAVEPLVAALEAVLDAGLDPVDLAPAPGGAVCLAVEARDSGALRHRLLLACAADAGFAPAPLPPDLAAIALLRPALGFCVDGPLLPAGRWAALAPGDLVLLGVRPLAGRLSLGGDPAWPATLDLAAASLAVSGPTSWRQTVTDAPEARTDAPPGDWAAARLPLTLEIDAGTLPLGELSGLAGGSTVRLGAAGAALRVRLLAGGVRIGTGELVAIGDGYGVLVTAREG